MTERDARVSADDDRSPGRVGTDEALAMDLVNEVIEHIDPNGSTPCRRR